MTNTTTDDAQTPFLSTKAYDTIRLFAQVILPAAGTFYAALALIWLGNAYVIQVNGTIAAIEVVLAVLMGISKSSFQSSGGDGTLNTTTGQVELNDPSVLDKDTIVLTKGSTNGPVVTGPVTGADSQ